METAVYTAEKVVGGKKQICSYEKFSIHFHPLLLKSASIAHLHLLLFYSRWGKRQQAFPLVLANRLKLGLTDISHTRA